MNIYVLFVNKNVIFVIKSYLIWDKIDEKVYYALNIKTIN